MILWTTVPFEMIFPSEPSKSCTMEFDGGILEGTRSDEGFTVSRLISTDPKQYLKKENAPGYLRKF
jgi:hypothetical protein